MIHEILFGTELGTSPIVEALIPERVRVLNIWDRGIVHTLVVETISL